MIGIAIANSLGLNRLSAIDPAAQAFITAAGITGSTQQDAINNLVVSLKANNLWSKMKAVYPFVTDNRNLFGYTEDFSNAYWIKTGATVTANTIVAPNGTTTGDTINFTGSIYFSTTLSGIYTFSVYLKYKGSQWACVENYNAPTDKAAWFDIQNGVLGTTSNAVSSSIENVGNGWYRCSLTTNASNAFPSLFAFFTTTTNGGFTRNNDLYTWGAQLELGSTATAYQPILTTQQAYIASQFKYNLVNPVDSDAAFRLVFNGGWTHSSTGATPNGTNGYADTKINPFLVLSTSSAHFAKYNRTNDLVGDKLDGAYFNATTSWFQQNYTSANSILGNGATASYIATDTRGLFTATRTATNAIKVFRNSANVASNTTAITTLPNTNVFLGARNDNGTTVFYNSYQAAFASIGDGLTDTEAANLYTAVQAFQTALSRQV